MSRWKRLIICVFAVAFVMVALPKGLRMFDFYRQLTEASRNKGIQSGALFYTEEPLCLEAETSLRNITKYREGRVERTSPARIFPVFK